MTYTTVIDGREYKVTVLKSQWDKKVKNGLVSTRFNGRTKNLR